MQYPTPSFIVGLPRSGTTLLSVMLNNHPLIYCPPEPWILLALESIGQTHPAHPAGADLIGTGYHAFLPPKQRMIALRIFAHALYHEKLKSTGKTHFIDKTPRYYVIFDFIKKLFPHALCVFAIRNPLDIAASYKNSWEVDIASDILQHRDTLSAADFVLGIEFLEKTIKIDNKNHHFIHYESLTKNPTSETTDILQFLSLPLHQNMNRFELIESEYQNHSFGDKNILKTTSTHQKSMGKWTSTFTKQELSVLLNAIGSESLIQLGYQETVDELANMGIQDKGTDYCQHIRNVYRVHKDKRMLTIHGDCHYGANPPT